jgi:thiol-disulfide isomerase/thioredoxin
MKRSFTILGVLVLATCAPADRRVDTPPPGAARGDTPVAQTTRVHGRLLGSHGAPMAQGHLWLYPNPGGISVAAQPLSGGAVGADGRFEFETEHTGYLELAFSGPGHAPLRMGTLVEYGDYGLTVRLGTDLGESLPDHLDAVGHRGRHGARTELQLVRVEDGTYTATLTVAEGEPPPPKPKSNGDVDPFQKRFSEDRNAWRDRALDITDQEFAYQIAGLSPVGGRVGGTDGARILFDGSGSYQSVVPVDGDEVRVQFDPERLPARGIAPTVQFEEPDSAFARATSVGFARAQRGRATLGKLMAYYSAGNTQPAVLMKRRTEYRDADQLEIAKTLESETDPVRRRMRLMSYVALAEAPGTEFGGAPSIFEEVRESFEPTDPLWSMWPSSLGSLATDERYSDAWREYARQAIDDHPDADVGALVLASLIGDANTQGSKDAARADFLRYSEPPFSQTVSYIFGHRKLDPDRSAQVGSPLPEFSLPVLGDTERHYTGEDLRGRLTLVTFWATWCGPCVAEMEEIHHVFAEANKLKQPKDGRAYRRPKRKELAFEVFSISFDHAEAEVAAFRKDEWPMPWKHAWVSDERRQAEFNRFSFNSFPTMMLVDAEGKILETDSSLRSGKLKDAVERHL